MSFTLALNSANDLTIPNFGNGAFGVVTGKDEVRQRILVTLQHFWYEYWLNLHGGVPWYELILGSKDRAMAEAVLRKIVLSVPGVISILSFSTTFAARKFGVTLTAEVQGGSLITVNLPDTLIDTILDGGLFSLPQPSSTTDGGGF